MKTRSHDDVAARGLFMKVELNCFRFANSNIRDFKIPGRLTSRTVILGAEDWFETNVLGGKLSTLRSGLVERRTAANLKFLALFVNHGIF